MNEDAVLINNLKLNKILTRFQFESLIEESEKSFIKEKIILLLSYKQRSKEEIIQRLKNKFHLDNIIQIISEMEELGYIDDKSFAKEYAKHLIKVKMLGKRAVYSKFFTHKISKEVAYDGPSYSYIDLLLFPQAGRDAHPNFYDPHNYRIRADVGWHNREDEAMANILSSRGYKVDQHGRSPTKQLSEALDMVNKSFYDYIIIFFALFII